MGEKAKRKGFVMHERVDANADLCILKCRLSEEEYKSLHAMIWDGGEKDIHLAKEAINTLIERL